MTRVLLLAKGLGRGGAEQLIVSSVRYWDRARFDYEVAYLLPWKDALVGPLEDAGVPVHLLGDGRGPGWVPRLRRLVRDRGIEIVHLHAPYAAIGARLGLAGPRRPRVVYTEHAPWTFYKRPTRIANHLTYGMQDHVFAVSAFVREAIRPGPGPAPPIEVLHHGIDPAAVATWGTAEGVRAELGIAEDAPLVGTVANFRPQKAYEVLTDAAAILRDARPDVRVVYVGTGPLEDDVRRQVRARGLEDTVVFAGFRDDAPRLMQAFDVFVLASRYEGLSIAMIEAMTLGRPMVVTRAGGIREVLDDGVHAAMAPVDDAPALAAAILRVLDDRDFAARLGSSAREHAADFQLPAAVRRQEQVYAELLG